jgi:hypothetical protein
LIYATRLTTPVKGAGLFLHLGRISGRAKISAPETQPERLCRRAEKLVAGGLKAAEMNAVK